MRGCRVYPLGERSKRRFAFSWHIKITETPFKGVFFFYDKVKGGGVNLRFFFFSSPIVVLARVSVFFVVIFIFCVFFLKMTKNFWLDRSSGIRRRQ